ncbi:MAG: hypothetical protein A2117_02770, partial [Candidatus Wildermuthbacteria bacterium GWA2_46_15]
NARENSLEKVGEKFLASVKTKPKEGGANSAVIKLVANYFVAPIKNIIIISGHKSKNKKIAVYM